MQLGIISALQSDVTFSTALAKAQTISRKYSCSTKAKDILKDVVLVKGLLWVLRQGGGLNWKWLRRSLGLMRLMR